MQDMVHHLGSLKRGRQNMAIDTSTAHSINGILVNLSNSIPLAQPLTLLAHNEKLADKMTVMEALMFSHGKMSQLNPSSFMVI